MAMLDALAAAQSGGGVISDFEVEDLDASNAPAGAQIMYEDEGIDYDAAYTGGPGGY